VRAQQQQLDLLHPSHEIKRRNDPDASSLWRHKHKLDSMQPARTRTHKDSKNTRGQREKVICTGHAPLRSHFYLLHWYATFLNLLEE